MSEYSVTYIDIQGQWASHPVSKDLYTYIKLLEDAQKYPDKREILHKLYPIRFPK